MILRSYVESFDSDIRPFLILKLFILNKNNALFEPSILYFLKLYTFYNSGNVRFNCHIIEKATSGIYLTTK